MKWVPVVLATILFQAVSISVTPESGPPGASLVVTGTGFQAGDRVRVLWDGGNLGGTAKAESDGTFTYNGTVPGGASVGPHTVEARGKNSSAQTTFTVVAATTTTTTSPTTTTTTAAPTTTVASSTTASSTTAATSPTTTAAKTSTTTSPAASTTSTVAGDHGPTTTVAAISPEVGESSTTMGVASETSQPVAEGSSPVEESGGHWWPGIVSLGALAMSAAFLWRRFRPAPPPAAVAEIVAEPWPVATGPKVEDRDGAWTRQPLDLSPPGKLIAAAGVEAGFVGFGFTTDDDGEERAAVWGSRSGTAWEGLAVFERGRASVVAPWQSGLMLLGTLTTMPYTASAWWSGDGYQWHRLTIADDPVLAGVSFEGAAATTETVVAFGRGPRGPGTWFTTEGRNWQPSPLRGAIDLIGSVPGGLVAFGRHLEERRPLLALSSDGISWTQLPTDSVFMFEGIAMAAALPFGGGLVAAGNDKMKGAATVWVSDDGFRWHRTPFEPESGTSIEHLAALNGHLVAVGTDAGRRRTGRPPSLAIWESTDAVNWERTESEGLFATARATTVAGNGARVLICGALAAGNGSPWPEPVPVSWMCEVAGVAVPQPALASS